MARRSLLHRCGAAVLGALLSGCGGGGAHSASPGSPAGGGLVPSGAGNLRIALSVPPSTSAQSKSRRPQYVSPSTKSISISVNGGSAINVNLTTGSPACQADLTKPTFTEFPVNIQPRGVTLASDGNIWFAEDAGGGLGSITPGGAYSDVPTGVFVNDLTTGPDGALYVAEPYYTAIGRIVPPSRSFGTFAALTTDVSHIVVGSDGEFWYIPFTMGQKAVYHVDTTGAVIGHVATQGNLGTLNDGATAVGGITPGPDGAIWLTEVGGTGSPSWIGRLATSGSLQEDQLTTGAMVYAIVTGPDGALWFLDSQNMLDRLVPSSFPPSGSVTPNNRYPITNANGYSYLVSGPDGALWFTENGSNQVGRMTTSGSLTEFTVPTANSAPTGIAFGSDGAVYVAEQNANKVARLQFPVDCTATVNAPGGSATVSVTAYDAVGGVSGSGHELSSQMLPVTVAANGVTNLELTLNPVVNSVVPVVAVPPACTPSGSITILLQAADAAGNIIIGPGNFVDANGNPLTIALSNSPSGGTAGTLSAMTFAAPPTTPITLTWSGGLFAGTTIAPSVSGGTISGALTPLNIAPCLP